MTRFSLPVLALLLATPALSGTEWEEDQMIINRINDTDFEVIEEQDMGPRGFWCGAATFTERRSGLPNGTEIFIKSPRGAAVTMPGRTGVVFTYDGAAVPDVPDSVSVNVDAAGQRLKSFQARGFCRDAFTRATK